MVFDYLKKSVLFLLKMFLKAHIRLLHFITTNTIPFIFLVLIMFNGLYGVSRIGFAFSKMQYVCFFIASYIFITSSCFYILVNNNSSKKFLEKLLTKQYLEEYLGVK